MKRITRKNFIVTSLTGLAAIRLIDNKLPDPGSDAQLLRNLGNTGIKVTPLCFGAPRTNEESLIRYALDKGINFIDTGHSYGNGKNEALVGSAVKGRRDKVIIQTKIRLEMNELPSRGIGRKGADEIRNAIVSKVDISLKALNTNYIDILLYHDALDENLLFNEMTMKTFAALKMAGKIRAHGFSTHNDYMNLIERNINLKFYDVNMIPFNHKGSFVHSVTGNYSEWDQEKLTGLLEKASASGTGIIAMKTCSGGKYSPSSDTAPDFPEAVRWVLGKKYVSSAAVAMANFEQVNEHLKLLKVS